MNVCFVICSFRCPTNTFMYLNKPRLLLRLNDSGTTLSYSSTRLGCGIDCSTPMCCYNSNPFDKQLVCVGLRRWCSHFWAGMFEGSRDCESARMVHVSSEIERIRKAAHISCGWFQCGFLCPITCCGHWSWRWRMGEGRVHMIDLMRTLIRN